MVFFSGGAGKSESRGIHELEGRGAGHGAFMLCDQWESVFEIGKGVGGGGVVGGP